MPLYLSVSTGKQAYLAQPSAPVPRLQVSVAFPLLSFSRDLMETRLHPRDLQWRSQAVKGHKHEDLGIWGTGKGCQVFILPPLPKTQGHGQRRWRMGLSPDGARGPESSISRTWLSRALPIPLLLIPGREVGT